MFDVNESSRILLPSNLGIVRRWGLQTRVLKFLKELYMWATATTSVSELKQSNRLRYLAVRTKEDSCVI